jgi:2-polyprenyl-3-methyl-5-hydroxy-6-metoxy-1,4-benzoquinol methylase
VGGMASDTSYSQGHAPSVLRSQTWRNVDNSAAYLAPYLKPGVSVLDVGCGTGTITLDMARRVAPAPVVGVDREPSVVRQAEELAAAEGVDNVRFEVGDAYRPVPSGEGRFGVVHAHQVLLHLADPVAALRAMLAAAAPGGVVAARDTDYGAMTWWPPDPRLDRWRELYRGVAHDHGGEPDAGRRLLAWAHAAGATQVTPSVSHWLHATPPDREAWGGMWAERIVASAIAEDAVTSGRATRADLDDISSAWRRWVAHPDGWFLIPHGEILCAV